MIDYRSSEGQRRRLADALEAGGHLRTDAWRKAIETVPREIFVPEFFRYRPMTDAPASWEPVVVEVDDNEAALTEIYSDDSLVTQLDGSLRPGDVEVAVTGTPTSSATMPSLVARMWEQLLVDDSNQVLEVGTGSGYSTALGCARLGDHFVTSVDVDSTLTTRAKHALATAGFKPRLAALDAVRSIPEPMGEGYDRVIATCSFRAVPRSWLASSRVDALILVTLTGWLDASALVRLKVTGDGTATGRLMDDPATFMPARTQAAPGISEFSTNAGNDETRPTALSLGVQDEPIHRFLMQLSVPGLQHATSGPDDVPADYFVDIANGSYAQLTDSQVRQRGQLRIWDEVERSIEIWRAAGSPGVDAFQVQIDPTGEFVVLGDHRWRLPVE